MALPVPEPGLVLGYNYLWTHEHDAGLEEGRKARPCAVILAREVVNGVVQVSVVPITHSPPTCLARNPGPVLLRFTASCIVRANPVPHARGSWPEENPPSDPHELTRKERGGALSEPLFALGAPHAYLDR